MRVRRDLPANNVRSDPIALAHEVHNTYKRYLRTTFYFRDPELRRSFEEALDAGDLARGPYLEATPVFQRGPTPAMLLPSLGLIGAEEAFVSALKGDRPLYQHQEQAILKVASGRNVVVATGTGSGKTEAFLYPILMDLYREFGDGQLGPGVRALILYPMNALSHDQRERLGEICGQLGRLAGRFTFKFGQYTGETPEDERDSERRASEVLANRLPGELVLRKEMREEPPHILLTNYSMLEYLLLRPSDSPLFDNGRAAWWRYLVLDEAHQYRGSRGIEMAMLIRRLKRRLREGGMRGPLLSIATSATLAGGPDDRGAVATFASDLFGEPFSEEDVILPEGEVRWSAGSQSLSLNDYEQLLQAIESNSPPGVPEALVGQAPLSRADGDVASAVGGIVVQDRRAATLRNAVTGRSRHVKELAEEIFPEVPGDERVRALSTLTELLVRAKDPETGSPLLSARYHFFLRSLEGAFVSYEPVKRVTLERSGSGDITASFEVALCRECGQHYFVGRVRDGHLVEAMRDPNDEDFGATFFRPLEAGSADDEEETEDGESRRSLLQLCLECAAIEPLGPEAPVQCGHSHTVLVEQQEAAAEREDQIPRCSSCGYRAPDPVREVVHGADGPHAVIATTLFKRLPASRRKILAFADSRQEAAFFAWYLDATHHDVLSRHFIHEALGRLSRHTSDGVTLRELSVELSQSYREEQVLPPSAGELELRREAWLRLYREFLTEEARISLEGVGLIQWLFKWPDDLPVPSCLTADPWGLSDDEARALVALLLNTLRTDGAVEIVLPDGISLNWDDLGLQRSQLRVRIGAPRRQPRVRSWDGPQGRRVRFLAKLLCARGLAPQEVKDAAVATLRAIWEAITDRDGSHMADAQVLVRVEDGRRLNPAWWRAHPVVEGTYLSRCTLCASISSTSVMGLCAKPTCAGKGDRVSLSKLDDNHYRALYREDLPGNLRVEEHTAQLSYEKAREFQRAFRSGSIHVLSCSTTFELGVDLGNLDVVFLRNVPPQAFNYAQRVGRAGRRASFPGFAITYCRRGAHDLYHFADPRRIIDGQVRPPTLALVNPRIVTRHVTATALARFFRYHPDRFGSIEAFMADLEQPRACEDFRRFVDEQAQELEAELAEIVPRSLRADLGLETGAWVDLISGPDCRLALAQAEVTADHRAVSEVERSAAARREYRTADWARARANTISREDVLTFLSRKCVIPKYGFPVDVVELDTQSVQSRAESSEVLLQRDLSIAIAEFAPTCRLVANKREWTSYSLKRVPEREWPQKQYRRCPRHNVFQTWVSDGQRPPPECDCRPVEGTYIEPIFGFSTNRDAPRAPRGRPTRVFATRPYFVGLGGRAQGELDFGSLRLTKASSGEMVVLCEGRKGGGFWVCQGCGAGFCSRVTEHSSSFNRPCRGTLKRVSLGHGFSTDVIGIQFQTIDAADQAQALWDAYGLAFSLLHGAAEILEIPPEDLNATVLSGDGSKIPPIVLYDDVPGGAGLVARLEDEGVLRLALEAGLERVSGRCGCSEESSCYGCLRTYRNQFVHPFLRRGPVARHLEHILGGLVSPTSSNTSDLLRQGPQALLVTPGRPYTNVMQLRRILREARSYVWWVDMHFAARALEELVEGVDHSRIREIRILSGPDNVNDRAKRDFQRFRAEMERASIRVAWRVVRERVAHDRYIITEGKSYNVPPVNSLLRGSYSEILLTPNVPPFETWWAQGVPLEEFEVATP